MHSDPSTERGVLRGALVSILAAALVIVPPVLYQAYNCFLGWHDVGNYTRAVYTFVDFGHFVTASDGTDDFFATQHFKPILFALILPVRLLGTPGFVAAITLALVLSAGYVFALTAEIGRSRRAAALAAAAFVANPYTLAIALSYHVETIGMLCLLGFAYHARARQTGRAWLALLVALTVKEDMWVYASVIAVLVGTRDRAKHTAAFVAAAAAYYAGAVLFIGGRWYPGAHYFNAFYLGPDGQPLGKLQIARLLLGRWTEFPRLLLTGPGLAFQVTGPLLCVFAGWRYLVACGVMLLWVTYPAGPPRSNFSEYYSYASLTVFFVVLPFALANLERLASWAARRWTMPRLGAWAVDAAVGVALAVSVTMHLPGFVPEPILRVDPRIAWGKGPGVNVPVVRSLIARHLTEDRGAVLSQFYTFCAVPQRRLMYVTLWDVDAFLAGRLKPKWVLLDLNAQDPWVTRQEVHAVAAMVRGGANYRAVYDAGGVLLYRHVANNAR